MAYAKLVRDQNGSPIQALSLSPSGVATAAISSSSVSAALPAGCDIVRIAASNDCYIKFGDGTVVAAAGDSVFPKGAELFAIPAGTTHIAVIQLGAVAGVVSITPML
jgi:hypothetical protein